MNLNLNISLDLFSFGFLLRILRKKFGLSQARLAEIINNDLTGTKVTQGLIAQYEANQIKHPDKKILLGLSNILDVDIILLQFLLLDLSGLNEIKKFILEKQETKNYITEQFNIILSEP